MGPGTRGRNGPRKRHRSRSSWSRWRIWEGGRMRRVVYVLMIIGTLVVVVRAANFLSEKNVTSKQGESRFRIFNPETMAKPTAGYSHVAEVTEGKLVYIAGQVAIDRT